MKVIETIYTREDMWSDYTTEVEVEVTLVDEEGSIIKSVSIGEGEPEDMTLNRDLSDAYEILDLVKKAYELGREGVEVEFESETNEY